MGKKNDYYSSIHRLGKWSTLVVIGLMFLVPLGTTLVYGVKLDVGTVLLAAFQLSVVFIPTQLTEVISYGTILGAGGTYLSFITGNVSNMKLPAAAAGHRLMGVEPYSDEGEVVSVLAIGISSITTTVIIFAGMFLLSPFIHYLESPVLSPAFNNIVPALLGVMLIPYLQKNLKHAILPIVISVVAGTVLSASVYSSVQGFLLIGVMVVSSFVAVLMEKGKK